MEVLFAYHCEWYGRKEGDIYISLSYAPSYDLGTSKNDNITYKFLFFTEKNLLTFNTLGPEYLFLMLITKQNDTT